MTVVRPNSIAGINSITVQTGQALNIHDANGNLIRNITSSTGISTFQSVEVTSGDLKVGVSTFFVDNSASRIGIGTNVPDASLSIGDGSTTTTMSLKAGTGNSAIINFGDTADDNIGQFYYYNTDNAFRWTTNTVADRMTLDSTGRLLIGTTSDVSPDSFGSKLQIDSGNAAGSISIGRHTASASGPALLFHKSRSGSAAGGTIVLDDDTLGIINFYGADGADRNSTAAAIAAEVDGTPGSNDMPGRLVFRTTSDGSASATERLRIDCRGFVGINENAPDELLHLSANNNGVTAVTSANNTLRFTDIDTTVTSNQPGGVIEWETLDSTAAGVNAYISTKNSNTGYSSLHFGTGNTSTLEDRLVLGQGGDLTLYGTEGTSANLYLMADQGDDDGDGWRIGSNQDDNDLTIANNDSGSYVDIVRLIHKVGNTATNMLVWGQGVTDNNEAMLTVKGTTTGGTDRHSQLLVAKHSNITNLASAMRWQSDDGTTRYLYMDNSVTVRLSGNYTDIGTTSGTVIGSQSSDIRLKNLIGDGSVPYGLSEINQLNPIKFKYKKTGGDPDRIQIGFSAQQVKPIIPEAVYDTGEEVEGEENILGMDYVNIIPALVNSIKELTAEVESLKTQVAELKSS